MLCSMLAQVKAQVERTWVNSTKKNSEEITTESAMAVNFTINNFLWIWMSQEHICERKAKLVLQNWFLDVMHVTLQIKWGNGDPFSTCSLLLLKPTVRTHLSEILRRWIYHTLYVWTLLDQIMSLYIHIALFRPVI